MGRSSGGGGEQIQRIIKEVPEEAKPFLYGSGDKFIEDPDTGEMIENPDYVQGLLPRAQELFTGEMPGYQIAGQSPLQQQAYQLGAQGIGAYQPYLDAAAGAQFQGLKATGQALDATRALAGQIPGQVGLGQQALGAAGQGVLAAAGRGELAAQQGAQGVLGAAQQGAQGVLDAAALGQGYGTQASDALFGMAGRGQSIAGQAGAEMALAGQRGRGFAESGISKADIAAERARRSTAGAQQALMEAGQFGRGTAGMGIASLRGAAGQYDPRSAAAFYNPFETQAISAALGDIERAGARQLEDVRKQTEAEALAGGAFSGGRRFLERYRREDPIREEILRRQATTAAGMRQAGFESAAQRAQSAFEQARGRQIQRAGVMGQLGQAGAGTQISAAGQAGQLGLSAEQLAQRSALGGAEIGLRGEQQAGTLAQGAGQLGLAGLGQDVATTQAAGQMGMAGAGMGMQGAAQAAGLGMQGAGQAASLGMQGAGMGMQGAGQAANLGMQGAGMGMQGAGQAGQLGAQAAGLGIQGITTGLGAQQQAASLGQGIGGFGMQLANLGGMQQQMGMADVNLLSQLGGQQQRYGQSVLDAQRATAMLPYQQVGFFSDILQGAPIGTAQTSFAPGPSPFQQALGGAIAYGNLNRSGYI